MEAQIKIGDTVVKKSGKPFQNGEKSAVVASFGKVVIPKGSQWRDQTKTVDAVELVGCEGLVTISVLRPLTKNQTTDIV